MCWIQDPRFEKNYPVPLVWIQGSKSIVSLIYNTDRRYDEHFY
jgi:hypothetical protein